MTQSKQGVKLQLNWSKSKSLHSQIMEVIPGGVNSPFRSFHEVGGTALFMESGDGSYVYDIDGNKYIDYVGAWGPSILGHCPQAVIDSVKSTLDKGFLFGSPHKLELELAQKIVKSVPSIDSIRFVNSGTEAVMSAIRLARGFTGKELVVSFEGCYHGHSDATLATNNTTHSKGIPKNQNKNNIEATFNDLASVSECFEKHKGEIACLILEPVTGSMGVIEPEIDFLKGLRELCTKYDALLIFDEVLTGFRVAFGGAQCLYDIEPDLTCFGKLLGGGMPIGAYGGRFDIMQNLMPVGKVYQAGTFAGNPLSMAGGLAILEQLEDKKVYKTLEVRSSQLFAGLKIKLDEYFQDTNIKPEIQLQRVGSMFSILFAPEKVVDFKTSQKINNKLFAKFFQACLNQGIYLPPSAQDAACLSYQHSMDDIDKTVNAFAQSIWQALSVSQTSNS